MPNCPNVCARSTGRIRVTRSHLSARSAQAQLQRRRDEGLGPVGRIRQVSRVEDFSPLHVQYQHRLGLRCLEGKCGNALRYLRATFTAAQPSACGEALNAAAMPFFAAGDCMRARSPSNCPLRASRLRERSPTRASNSSTEIRFAAQLATLHRRPPWSVDQLPQRTWRYDPLASAGGGAGRIRVFVTTPDGANKITNSVLPRVIPVSEPACRMRSTQFGLAAVSPVTLSPMT